eukprot:TRINITY_DN566_c0_g1_i12.p1 TRINITY_DN566_c0_g1~~TRINITY_DN566_c0_g1_i12.p1  ORF type:complete len:241 (-),score=100.73 TRINITY_DN566_c0_g1_i12:113-835(-)
MEGLQADYSCASTPASGKYAAADADVVPFPIEWWVANWNDIVGGKNNDGSVWAEFKDTSGAFKLHCVASLDDSIGGLPVGPYAVKCDVEIDFTNLWLVWPFSLYCDDANRFVAVRLLFASASWDTNPMDEDINGSPDRYGQNVFSFDGGNTTFKWVNYATNVDTGDQVPIHAEICTSTANTTYLPPEATEVRDVVFSFMQSKAEGGNHFYWDPTFAFGGGCGVVPLAVLLLAALVAHLLL